MSDFTFSQEQRLQFIDFRLMFVGYVTRAEVVEYFKSGLSSATRDINLYKDRASDNLIYDNAEKKYFATDTFTPLFEHSAQKSAESLIEQLTDQNTSLNTIRLSFEKPSQLVMSNISILATLTQAIIKTAPVKISYISLSSGKGSRTIIPHSIVDNGLRWHIRAFDIKTNEFRDFVVSRILTAEPLDTSTQDHQTMLADKQWMRFVPLELVPHPNNIKYPEAIELDYGMKKGVLHLESRAALTGYLLRRWNVDCSEDASLNTPEFQLWLRNSPTLYGIENIHLAAGYKTPQPVANTIPSNEDTQ